MNVELIYENINHHYKYKRGICVCIF